MKLLPYQETGVNDAMRRFASGDNVLLADEMGLGKTVQAIECINRLYSNTKVTVLVICPLTLRQNWLNEIDRWHTSMASITVCSFTQIHKLPEFLSIELLVIDEAHLFKNMKTQRAGKLATFIKRAKRKLALTGTPADNRPKELWALLLMLDAKRWGKKPAPRPRVELPAHLKVQPGIIPLNEPKKKSKYSPAFLAFAKRYCGAKRVPIPGKFVIREGERQPMTAWDFSGGSNLNELNRKLRETIMIRRLKKDVLRELPPKRRQLIEIPSPVSDNRFFSSGLTLENYDAEIARLHTNKVLFREFSEVRHLQALGKCGYVVSHCLQLLSEIDKLVVFCHHRDVASLIGQGLRDSGLGVATLTGETDAKDRQTSVDVFQQDPNCRVFIGSIGAAGVGITLTVSATVVFAELDPNPARMTQAEDRCHRIGQRDMVIVHHVLSNGSIDARIAKILVEKQALLDAALNEAWEPPGSVHQV